MTHTARILFLVKDLLDELHGEKIELGTGAHLRVQELLRLLPASIKTPTGEKEGFPNEFSDEDLLLALAPLLAHSPQEQALVYEKFKICQQRANEIFGKKTEPTPPPPDPIAEKITRFKTWFWVSLAVLAMVLVGLAWVYFQKEDKAVVEKSLAVTAGQTTMICPSVIIELDTFGKSISNMVVEYSLREYLNFTRNKADWRGVSTRRDISDTSTQFKIGKASIQNDTCLSYAARDSVQGMDSLVLNVNFSNGNTCELRLKIFVSPPVEVINQPPPTNPEIPNFQPSPFPYDHTQALLDLEIKPADPWQAWLAQNWSWLRWLIFLPFTILLFALWRWLEWRRRKLIAELDRPDKPPYVWNIRIDGTDDIVLGDAFHHALQVMRRRSATDTLRLDLPRSIRATAEKGGMPAFQFRAQTQPVDYLLLIDRQSTQNHRAQLFDAVFKAMQAQELHIERFFYDSDIRVCFNEAYPDGLRLADISQRYGQARLIVVGTGLQLIHPANARLEPWAEVFKNWPARALFTPKPTDDWGRAERRLSELFNLFPATLQSLGFWVEELEHGDDARFERWRERVQDAPAAIYQPDDEHPLPMLLLQLPRELVHWVAACAIYPSLHWDLTLWLGRRLSKSSRLGKSDFESGTEPTVNLDNLLKIFRIRWFVQGQIPQTARAALLEWLEREDPTLIPRLRGELAALLAQSPPPKDSSAWADHRMAVVLNQWLSEPDQKKKKALEKEIEKLLPQTEADFTVLKYLNRPPSPLHFQVPESWKKFVYRGGFRALGFSASLWSTVGAALLWLLGAWGIFSWNPAPPEDGCKGQKLEYAFKSGTLPLCLDSPEDSLLWLERLALDTLESQHISAFDSLAARAMRLPATPDSMAHTRANFSTTLYNIGVDFARRGIKDSACVFFQKAMDWDTTEFDFSMARSWCENKPLSQPPAATKPVCRQVANVNFAVFLRSRSLKTTEINEIAQNPDGPLDRQTRVATVPLGQTVALLDSTSYFWKVRFGVKTGYIARKLNNKPLLLPCDQKTLPVTPGATVTTDPPARVVTPTTPIPIPEMIPVKGGTFTMGSPNDDKDASNNEKPAHPVTLSDFEMGKTEVTISQYLAFCDETKTHYPEWLEPGNDYNVETGSDDYYKTKGMSRANKNHPVTGVSWNDAVAYCEWLSQKVPGTKFRLPTEAEWEYAARGGQNKKGDFKYAGSDNIDGVAWYTENTNDSGARPVATKKENDLGLHDMSGNVWEWCADWYGDYADTVKPTLNPNGPTTGSDRVNRGGSWFSNAEFCRVSLRFNSTPVLRSYNFGFRLASSPQ
jgi:formylglycine-generating enzyme required for sulfatase activity